MCSAPVCVLMLINVGYSLTLTLELCGFVVTKGQLHLTEARKSTLLKIEYPKSICDLRRFICFVMYIKNFAQDLSLYLRPFFRMLRKGQRLLDTPHLRLLFDKLLHRHTFIFTTQTSYPDCGKNGQWF